MVAKIDFTNQEIADGQYRVLTKLGTGSFGDVYSARKISTKEIFAVKFEKYVENKDE